MAIEDKVRQAQRTKAERSEEFREQLYRGQAFKKRMQEAGVAEDDKYEIPLMRRMGHNTSI